jgi:xanthine dehydrogenase/oxidase
MMVTEMMMTEVADQMGIEQVRIRQLNMYKQGDATHFNAILDDWFLPEMWESMLPNYQQLKDEVALFNNQSSWKKRGVSLIPTKCGVAFSVGFLNQASASIHVYKDGSILISHGGIEMGQGLVTKIAQIAANTLQIPIEKIFISETATDKIANGSPTAASFSSDLYGMAVMNACNELNERLRPYRLSDPNRSFSKCTEAAYKDCVCLSACGFYKADEINYDLKTNTGMRFPYFSTGVAMSVVELDVLTGDHAVLRSDIVMDIGQSLNYAIDIGQIEGAFVQGLGGCTFEEPLLTSNGALLTRGPGNYKIPTSHDIPVEFNIKILKDKDYKHLKTIKSSKGTRK